MFELADITIAIEDQILDRIPDKEREFPLCTSSTRTLPSCENTSDLRPTLSNLSGLLSTCSNSVWWVRWRCRPPFPTPLQQGFSYQWLHQ